MTLLWHLYKCIWLCVSSCAYLLNWQAEQNSNGVRNIHLNNVCIKEYCLVILQQEIAKLQGRASDRNLAGTSLSLLAAVVTAFRGTLKREISSAALINYPFIRPRKSFLSSHKPDEMREQKYIQVVMPPWSFHRSSPWCHKLWWHLLWPSSFFIGKYGPYCYGTVFAILYSEGADDGTLLASITFPAPEQPK